MWHSKTEATLIIQTLYLLTKFLHPFIFSEDAICSQSNTGDKNGSFENEENLNVKQKCLDIASNGNKQGHEEV